MFAGLLVGLLGPYFRNIFALGAPAVVFSLNKREKFVLQSPDIQQGNLFHFLSLFLVGISFLCGDGQVLHGFLVQSFVLLGFLDNLCVFGLFLFHFLQLLQQKSILLFQIIVFRLGDVGDALELCDLLLEG